MELEEMINSQEASGMPTIARQIFEHMDFDTLLKCRTTSKTIRDFLDNEDQRTIWVSMIDKVRQETLDKLLHELPKPNCPQVKVMSEEEISGDHSKWIMVLDRVKGNGTIKDIIMICNFMKQTEKLILAFGSFGPLENLFSFYDTGDAKFGFEKLVSMDMKIFKTWIRLDLETENSLISQLWGSMIETVWRSDNSEVVYFFMGKMMAHDHMKFRDDIKSFDLSTKSTEESDTESEDDDSDDEMEDEDEEKEIKKYIYENKCLKFAVISTNAISLLFSFYVYYYWYM